MLRPGGKFYCLEFSTLPHAGAQRMYEIYNRVLIPELGAAIAGDRASYDYLVESIARFPDAPRLVEMMHTAKFILPQYRHLTGGIVAMHWGLN